jgi:hypothetical protein
MTQRERGPNREVKGGGATGVVINKLLVRVGAGAGASHGWITE